MIKNGGGFLVWWLFALYLNVSKLNVPLFPKLIVCSILHTLIGIGIDWTNIETEVSLTTPDFGCVCSSVWDCERSYIGKFPLLPLGFSLDMILMHFQAGSSSIWFCGIKLDCGWKGGEGYLQVWEMKKEEKEKGPVCQGTPLKRKSKEGFPRVITTRISNWYRSYSNFLQSPGIYAHQGRATIPWQVFAPLFLLLEKILIGSIF